MALNEKLKIAKVTEEITGYLLERGYTDISISLKKKDIETEFIIIVTSIGEDLEEVFKKDLYCCREIGLEEYGVDQLHQNCVCSLDTLGMLVDHYKVVKNENEYKIMLYRNIT